MLLKERTESNELLVLRSLNTRMALDDKENYHYLNLERGYEGEIAFDALTDCLADDRYLIHDLQLEVNGGYVQLDSVIVTPGIIHLIEVKNFQGDCYYDSDKLFSVKTQREYKNPLTQLKRSATSLRQLLQIHKQNYTVDAHVVFINPEFTLYKAPMDQPLVLPTQVNRFINKMKQTPSTLQAKDQKLAQTLLSLHLVKNPYESLPHYTYDQLQKGIYCKHCRSFMVYRESNVLVCKSCKDREVLRSAIIRNTKEYRLLFPDDPITVQRISDWCDLDITTHTISRALNQHFIKCGVTSDSYYQ